MTFYAFHARTGFTDRAADILFVVGGTALLTVWLALGIWSLHALSGLASLVAPPPGAATGALRPRSSIVASAGRTAGCPCGEARQ
jgi:hypothetical protein